MQKSKVFIVAGEASGDVIGGRLIRAMQAREPGISFIGIGGVNMENAGMHSIFPMQELSVMGVTAVILRYFQLRQRFNAAVQAALDLKPDLVITIDSPGFNFRLVKKLRQYLPATTKFVQYVAPSVWAYKPERAKVAATLYDHILLLFPFEQPYFDAVGMSNTVVGHPVLEQDKLASTAQFSKYYELDNKHKAVLVMPGSREAEVVQHLPIFIEALRKLGNNYVYFVPTLPHLVDKILPYAEQFPIIPLTNSEDKRQAMSVSQVALVKSGTASVEVMVHKVPMVVAYNTSLLTRLYIKHYVKIKYASIINLLLNRPAVPELLMQECTADKIYKHLYQLLTEPEPRAAQIKAMEEAMQLLGPAAAVSGQSKPSDIAADAIFKLMSRAQP